MAKLCPNPDQKSAVHLSANVSADPWNCVVTRYQCERRIESALQADGLEAFVPTTASIRQWRDRRVRLEQPLFPGYAFVRAGGLRQALSRILRLPGVVRFVTTGIVPAEIPDEEIEAVRLLCRTQIPCEPAAFPALGDPVVIRGGCLDGIHGVLTRLSTKGQVVISVGAIQRALTLHIGQEYQIERVAPSTSQMLLASA